MRGMQPGDHVTPTIKLVRRLGEGAMGYLWAAEHLTLGTLVAVKLMTPVHAQDAKSAARFRKEAQSAARLKSPHVTHVLDHGITADGHPYIVMELLEGETLRTRMQRCGPLPVDEVVRTVGQTAKALSAAHRRSIVHRDIKPENLFLIDVEGEPFVKVLDFGIAKQVDADEPLTSTEVRLGTPRYMSPEQLSGTAPIDARTDLWALGVVTYEALTGAAPFNGQTMLALAMAILQGAFAPPSTLRPELPKAVDAWMARALAVDVEARFGTAKSMAEALSAAIRRTEPAREPSKPPAAGTPEAVALADTLPVAPEHAAQATADAKERTTQEGASDPDRHDTARDLQPPPAQKSDPPVGQVAGPVLDTREIQVVHDPVHDVLSLFGSGLSPHTLAFDESSTALFVGFLTGAVLCLDLETRRPRWWRHLFSSALCITTGAGWVAVGCVNGVVHLIDASRGTIAKALRGHAGAVRGVDIHRRGHLLAACSDDTIVTLWDVDTRERLHVDKAHPGRVRGIAFETFNTSLATAASDATVRLWDATLQPTRVLRIDGGSPDSLSFSPRGRYLAAGCDDGAIRLWETAGWSLTQTLTGHRKRVASVAFGQHRRLVSGSWDGTVRSWETDSGKALCVLGEHDGVIECVAMSPDGRYAASACADGKVRVYGWSSAI